MGDIQSFRKGGIRRTTSIKNRWLSIIRVTYTRRSLVRHRPVVRYSNMVSASKLASIHETLLQKARTLLGNTLGHDSNVFVIPSNTTLLTQRFLINTTSLSGIITAVENELDNLRCHSLCNQSAEVWILCNEMLSDLLKLNKSVSYWVDSSFGNDWSSILSDYRKQLIELRDMCDTTLVSHDRLHNALVNNAKQKKQDTAQVNSCLSHVVYPIVLTKLLGGKVSLNDSVILLNQTVEIGKSMSFEDRRQVNDYYAIKTHA